MKTAKSKIYKFFMTYGRNGTPEEVADARKVLNELQWAPFKPSSDAQLYPIRILSFNKEILKVKSDEKMSGAEKKAKIAELQKKSDQISIFGRICTKPLTLLRFGTIRPAFAYSKAGSI